jgi:acyl-CoA dehydrogenase
MTTSETLTAVLDDAATRDRVDLAATAAALREHAPDLGGNRDGWVDDTVAPVLRARGSRMLVGPWLEAFVLAPWLLDEASLSVPTGVATVAPDAGGLVIRDGHVHGRLRHVPWAAQADATIALVPAGTGHAVLVAPRRSYLVAARHDLAGEPRDEVTFDDVPLGHVDLAWAPPSVGPLSLRARGALGTAVSAVGALDRIRELVLEHASGREQFGRPIGRFQAVQRHLVELVGDTAAAAMAVDITERAGDEATRLQRAAIAKVRVGRAIDGVTTRAHQVVAARGMTELHPLGAHTRRCWAWRAEHGSTRWWAAWLGRRLAEPTDSDRAVGAVTAPFLRPGATSS